MFYKIIFIKVFYKTKTINRIRHFYNLRMHWVIFSDQVYKIIFDCILFFLTLAFVLLSLKCMYHSYQSTCLQQKATKHAQIQLTNPFSDFLSNMSNHYSYFMVSSPPTSGFCKFCRSIWWAVWFIARQIRKGMAHGINFGILYMSSLSLSLSWSFWISIDRQ